jgi:transposase
VSASEDPRRAEACRLRVEDELSVAQIAERVGVSVGVAGGWVRGLPIPKWTRRPRAKDAQRARALELRGQGWSANRIAVEVGVSQSTAYQWTKHIPLDATPEAAADRKSRHLEHMRESRWGPHRQARDAERATITAAAVDWVGSLSEREVRLIGAVAYSCEGAKEKTKEQERKTPVFLQFINRDLRLILIFLRYMEQFGYRRSDLRYRVSIHETADAAAAARSWSEDIGVPVASFLRATIKKHNPKTTRKDRGELYRGCLSIYVPKSSKLNWEIDGIVEGVALGLGMGAPAKI